MARPSPAPVPAVRPRKKAPRVGERWAYEMWTRKPKLNGAGLQIGWLDELELVFRYEVDVLHVLGKWFIVSQGKRHKPIVLERSELFPL